MKTNIPLVDTFLLQEMNHCAQHDITVNLAATKFLTCGSMQTSGWFDEDTLQVATGERELDDWLSTFVHESCHKDQFLEKSPAWDTKIKNFDALDLLDQWLEGVCELKSEQMKVVISKAQMVELDCEKRTVDKIIKYSLPIDVPVYIKRANIYMYFYTSLPYTRTWYRAPYNSDKLKDMMPDYFLEDYSQLPKDFIPIMKEFNATL